MLSIQETRECLGLAKEFSNEEVALIRDHIHALARLFVEEVLDSRGPTIKY